MEIDPVLTFTVLIAIAAICFGLLLKQLKQPYVIGYIIIGIIIGNFSINPLGVQDILGQFGNLGIVLLMFFIGIHISLPRLIARWRIAVIGTILQILVTLLAIWTVGGMLGWPFSLVLLIAFVLSLSSTAVIVKMLSDRKELQTKVGQNVLGILLVQDLAVVPMLVILDMYSGHAVSMPRILLQIAVGALLIGIIVRIMAKKKFALPFSKYVGRDHELQVFRALLMCFGLSLLTGWAGLSTAFGGFVAGLLVSATPEAGWVQKKLESFHVVLVALFFIYVGTLIDYSFVREHLNVILILTLGAFVLNTVINTLILRFLGDNWKESLYAGGLLSQIGEFSFLLGTIGYESGIVSSIWYQLIVAIIALTLLLTPLWLQFTKRAMHIDAGYVFELPERIHRQIKKLERNR